MRTVKRATDFSGLPTVGLKPNLARIVRSNSDDALFTMPGGATCFRAISDEYFPGALKADAVLLQVGLCFCIIPLEAICANHPTHTL